MIASREPNKSILNNNQGSALLVVIIIGFIIAGATMVTMHSARNAVSKVSSRRKVVSAFNYAEAGKEHAIAKIRSASYNPVAGIANIIITGETFEKGSYSVTYDANVAVDTLVIHARGKNGDQSALIDVVCIMNKVFSDINPMANAAVTTRAPTTVTGNITVDGRDWNAAGTSVVGNGVYGVKSSSTVSVDGNSHIGGRGTAPTTTPGSDVINLCPPSECPTTPEQALGLPEGALDSYKTTVEPSFPFHGIYYYEGTSEIQPNFGGSSGILIIHNSSLTGRLKNLQQTFTGIIIADQIVHATGNAKIIGTVITLGTAVGGNAYGNGNADVLYSSEVISNVISTYSIVTDSTYDIVSWKQLQ